MHSKKKRILNDNLESGNLSWIQANKQINKRRRKDHMITLGAATHCGQDEKCISPDN